MKDEYRLNVRFRYSKADEKRAADFLKHMDLPEYKSVNAFIVTAINHYIDYLESGERNLLDGIRKVVREEITGAPIPNAPQENPHSFAAELTDEDIRLSEQFALDALDLFK